MSFFQESDKARQLRQALLQFMDEHIYPNDEQVWKEAAAQRWDSAEGWTTCPTVARLKKQAQAQGLWNLFLPHSERAPQGLSNFEYAPFFELMGRLAPHRFHAGAQVLGTDQRFMLQGMPAAR